MDIFGLKKKKALKLQQEEEARKQKEIETKIRIKKTLSTMRSQTGRLNNFKNDYVLKARHALDVGNKQTYNLARQGLRLCMSKQKFLDAMISNFEIALQMTEMNKVINEFVGGMNLIAEEMKGVTSSIDIAKAQAAYEQALANNEDQYQALDAFLQEAESSIETFSTSDVNVTDEEMDELINEQVLGGKPTTASSYN